MLQRFNDRKTKAMRKLSLRQIRILKLHHKKNLRKITKLCRRYRSIKILIIKSYLLRSKQRNVNFKRNEIFVSLKQEINILKSLFIKTKLKRLIRIAFAKTILTTKITN
jgi:hypothetical protein